MADNAITRSALGSVQVGSYYFGQLAWQDRMIDLERTVRNADDNTQKALGMMDSNFSRYVSALGHKLDRSLCAIADVAYEGFAELSGLLRDSLETQIGIHQELCKISFHSEKIAQALIEGRQTRINEIFSGAIRLCEDNLCEEALHELDKCLAEYEYDFLVHYTKAKILLYGTAECREVIDLKKARDSFSLARKYGRRSHERLEDGKSVWSRVLMDSARCHYALANDARKEGIAQDSIEELQQALDLVSQPDCLEQSKGFFKAQVLTLLGKHREALDVLRIIIDDDRVYYYRALDLPDFADIHDQIAASKGELLLSFGKGILFNQTLDKARRLSARAAEEFYASLDYSTLQSIDNLNKGWQEFRGQPGAIIAQLQNCLKNLCTGITSQLERERESCSNEIAILNNNTTKIGIVNDRISARLQHLRKQLDRTVARLADYRDLCC